MAEDGGFKPIESQEELDRIIKDRLQRERDASNKGTKGGYHLKTIRTL